MSRKILPMPGYAYTMHYQVFKNIKKAFKAELLESRMPTFCQPDAQKQHVIITLGKPIQGQHTMPIKCSHLSGHEEPFELVQARLIAHPLPHTYNVLMGQNIIPYLPNNVPVAYRRRIYNTQLGNRLVTLFADNVASFPQNVQDSMKSHADNIHVISVHNMMNPMERNAIVIQNYIKRLNKNLFKGTHNPS